MPQTKTRTEKSLSKSEIFVALSENTGLTKAQVNSLFDSLAGLVGKNIGAGGPGMFTLPGLLKIKVVRKPATPARTGINPFTKQETTFKAKPARNVVKLQALKSLKAMV
ncbi:MAG: HU family DNA-binding protein [Planctomycetia bacterium]|nr:HU family DNA-binding protein [Planctomycetia bacterium]